MNRVGAIVGEEEGERERVGCVVVGEEVGDVVGSDVGEKVAVGDIDGATLGKSDGTKLGVVVGIGAFVGIENSGKSS